MHRVLVQNKQLKRRLRAILSCVDRQCGARTSRARRIDSGAAEMFNNSFQGLLQQPTGGSRWQHSPDLGYLLQRGMSSYVQVQRDHPFSPSHLRSTA
jgi:hypothetical protein